MNCPLELWCQIGGFALCNQELSVTDNRRQEIDEQEIKRGSYAYTTGNNPVYILLESPRSVWATPKG